MNDRRVVPLLATVTVLLALLVIGFGVAAVLAVRGADRLRRELAGTGDVVKELASRQEQASGQLASMARDARRQLAQLEQRAAELRHRGNGPIQTAAWMAELQQLMVDQMILALKQSTGLEEVLAKGARPADDAQQPAPGDAEPAQRSSRRTPAHVAPGRRREAAGAHETTGGARELPPPTDAHR